MVAVQEMVKREEKQRTTKMDKARDIKTPKGFDILTSPAKPRGGQEPETYRHTLHLGRCQLGQPSLFAVV